MGVKFFRREDHKTGISPYFPLCYFPDREHPDYCIYDLQQTSTHNIVRLIKENELESRFVN